ncbi:hypothetical protein ACFQ23_11865 [Schaalia naturae]|jgi:threonine/homoserine/homoserine lactone efflux protein|uniref:Lysine transporter LysE n=1 Tax=Schaalia naturae TaxID=635203 RepID=A0ABW2SP26_9ACTO
MSGVCAVVLALTPGPNNLISFDMARRAGLREPAPLRWGLAASLLVIDAAIIALASAFHRVLSVVEPRVKAVGSL